MKKKLYLLPNLLSPNQDPKDVFVPSIAKAIASIDALFAESEKEGEKFLKLFSKKMPIYLLNEHTTNEEIKKDLFPLLQKHTMGLISDCGLPCIADPGTYLVHLAREKNIPIQTFPGPSSIIQSLQVSGFSGQCFCFMGYLPRKTDELKQKLKTMEKRSFTEQMTFIWIETPYRTKKMIEVCSETLRGKTQFCMAQNLGDPKEKVLCLPISEWKRQKFVKEKEPSIFLLSSS